MQGTFNTCNVTSTCSHKDCVRGLNEQLSLHIVWKDQSVCGLDEYPREAVINMGIELNTSAEHQSITIRDVHLMITF